MCFNIGHSETKTTKVVYIIDLLTQWITLPVLTPLQYTHAQKKLGRFPVILIYWKDASYQLNLLPLSMWNKMVNYKEKVYQFDNKLICFRHNNLHFIKKKNINILEILMFGELENS